MDSRNIALPVGTENKHPSHGYWMVKTKTGWRFKHHIIAEQHVLGRPLNPDERVSFKDGNRDNLDPSNLEVSTKGSANLAKRRTALERTKRRLEWEIKQRHDELARVTARIQELNQKFGDTVDPPEEPHWRDPSGNLA